METAQVDELKSGHFDKQDQKSAKPNVRPHITYLEFLRDEGMLELAIRGELPKHVERAAKVYVMGELRARYGKEAVPIIQVGDEPAIAVTEEEKKTQDEEINDFLKTYGFLKSFELFIYKVMPRKILKGNKYTVKSGWFKGRPVLIKGLDREHFGCAWHENYGNPICEKMLWRVQQDTLPMRGLFYVVKILDEKRDIILHESELGDQIQ